ncbi:MAG: hypothetical protein P8N09_12200 [Planctomycetota bacterium]|jgi:hypothetical protein|nr:hypothetical protein [Planctomycetota bacterium]
MANDGVFHPGHDQLHGKTVVLFTTGARTYIGRWGEEADGVVHMMGVAVHEVGTDEGTRDEWVAKSKKFGFAVTANGATIPRDEIEKVAYLSDA